MAQVTSHPRNSPFRPPDSSGAARPPQPRLTAPQEKRRCRSNRLRSPRPTARRPRPRRSPARRPCGGRAGRPCARWCAARAQGLSNPVEIVPPTDSGTAYVVRQIQRSWPEKQDSVAIDPATGKVTDTLRFADYPVLAKLTRWGIDAHTGSLFGIVNQLALAALALALILMILWGYRMWWQRGRASAFGRPVPRGAWQHVPPHILVPLAATVALLGYFVPLLGIPLAAFPATDAVLSEIAHRRGKRAGTIAS
ncbi:PepSY domain-containing protein [Actinacidiphila oryziradicis]|uniref:PepSY domain-containing protein n=1 Tax=Actinacidiphila oryziradicis TaxID=2571141 RepID=UPI001FEB43DE|nr:PepSY domain-containing protein [Actinacidiphila oryziradicis]